MTKSVGDKLTARGLTLLPFFGAYVPFRIPNSPTLDLLRFTDIHGHHNDVS